MLGFVCVDDEGRSGRKSVAVSVVGVGVEVEFRVWDSLLRMKRRRGGRGVGRDPSLLALGLGWLVVGGRRKACLCVVLFGC